MLTPILEKDKEEKTPILEKEDEGCCNGCCNGCLKCITCSLNPTWLTFERLDSICSLE